MKSNLSKNKDYLKFLKPILYVCLVLVIIASVLVGFLGFNYGFDFTGGTQLVVQFQVSSVNIESERQLISAQNDIKDILSAKKVTVNSFQTQGDYSNKSFVITFKDVSDEDLNDIRLAINEKFNTSTDYLNEPAASKIGSNFDMTRQTTKISSLISPDILLVAISTLLFALTLVMIYALFRLKIGGAMTLFIGGVFDVLLSLAFIAIVRIEINTYIFAVVAVTLILSIYSSIELLFDLKEKTKSPLLVDKTNYELANMSVKDNMKKNIIISIIAVAIAVIAGVIGARSVLYVAISSIVSIAIVFASHIFVIPSIWAGLNKKRTLNKVVKTETNDEDKNAEEIIVEE